MLSLKKLYKLSERKPQKSILLADYFNLCNNPLHKFHLLKKRNQPKTKQRYLIFLIASKGTIIPVFDGTVVAIFNTFAITK